MTYTVSKKLFALSLLAITLVITTFTFAKQDDLRAKEFKWWSGTLISGQIACIKTAVEKRETSIIVVTTTFQTAILQALNTRKTDLLNARSLPTKAEIKTAVKKSRDNFKSNKKTAREAIRSWEKSAWSIFKTDKKACKLSSTLNWLEMENENTTKTID